MKKTKKQELLGMNRNELQKRLAEEKKKCSALRIEREAGKLKDLRAYSKKRKEIALIQTILRERELSNQVR